MTQAELLWQPGEERIRRSQMYGFMQSMAEKYGFKADWPALHQWSVDHCDEFWQELLDFAEVKPSRPATAVRAGEGMLGTKWFPGLEFNYAEYLLRFDDDHLAIEAEDELGRTRTMTFHELREQVARCATGMRALGVRRGDRVGAFIPNIPEAIIGMLAAASIGATWSSCSPDFGINGVFDRFGQIEPRLLIAADAYSYNGRKIDSLERIKGIVEKIPSIEKVAVIPFMDESPDISQIPNAVHWSELLAESGELIFEQLPWDHPLYIMYSSGTTGVPKCIVHGAGGTLIQHLKELVLHTDLKRDDKIMYFTTCGWMMWNWLVSSLGAGATVCLFEGSPGYPNMQHLWKFAERIGMTVFGTSAKYVSACEKAGIKPIEQQDLSKLRAVLSTASPLTIENFRWVYDNIKKNLQLSSICGGTDIISCFMLGNPILPVYAGEIQCIGLGMDVKAYDFNGKPVIGEKGELICCAPFPSQPTSFWNDENNEKYRSAYFEHYPGIWRHGDFVEITPRGGVIVYGRSDATLNPGGVRIGTAEIYRQVEALDEIVDSVVVGKTTADADIEVCLFVVLRQGLTLDDTLIKTIKDKIRAGATPRHVPRHIKQVTEVPYTISGKKVEMAVSNMIHGEAVLNRDALQNPQALDQYKGIV